MEGKVENEAVTKEFLTQTFARELDRFVTKDFFSQTLARELDRFVTKEFLARSLSDLERHMDQRLNERLESFQANVNSAIASAQARTLNWMVAIFLAATALVGTSVGVFTMVVLASG